MGAHRSEAAMRESWELLTAGPPDADRSVLLLPGGANAARSFDLVMADPALSGVRLVATTLPGMAGAPVSEDVSIPAMSRRAGELAEEHGLSWVSPTARRWPWTWCCQGTTKARWCSSASA